MKNIEDAYFSFSDIKFPIRLLKSNGFVDQEIFWKGCYEEDVLAVIKEKLPVNGVFVDIGSNIGDHTLFAAHVAKKGKVIAFEPVPSLYKQSLESVALSEANADRGEIILHNVACGKKNSALIIATPKNNAGGSSFVRESGEKQKVPVITGDSLLLSEQKIDMIKIDVEGFEYPTLLGLSKTIKKHHPCLVIELSPSLYKLQKNTCSDEKNILEFLKENGYTVLGIDESMPKTDDPLSVYPIKYDQVNLLCVHKTN